MAEQLLIDEGRKLVSQLKDRGINLAFAVWYTDPALQRIFLALGSKKFDEIGPSKAYEEILAVAESLHDQLQFFKTDFIRSMHMVCERYG